MGRIKVHLRVLRFKFLILGFKVKFKVLSLMF
jgi:hypothetical protein